MGINPRCSNSTDTKESGSILDPEAVPPLGTIEMVLDGSIMRQRKGDPGTKAEHSLKKLLAKCRTK